MWVLPLVDRAELSAFQPPRLEVCISIKPRQEYISHLRKTKILFSDGCEVSTVKRERDSGLQLLAKSVSYSLALIRCRGLLFTATAGWPLHPVSA